MNKFDIQYLLNCSIPQDYMVVPNNYASAYGVLIILFFITTLYFLCLYSYEKYKKGVSP